MSSSLFLGVRSFAFVVAVLVAAFAVALRMDAFTLLLNRLLAAPPDPKIGRIEYLDLDGLRRRYENRRVLVIGGTRGVGYGTALAAAKAGAHVTIVGRSEASGRRAVEAIRAELSPTDASDGRAEFLQGDIGTVCGATALVDNLASAATNEVGEENDGTINNDAKRYNYLVVTAAIFPDWSQPLLNEDGIDRSVAVAVVGRSIVYRRMDEFMNVGNSPRVLNVLAAGLSPPVSDLSRFFDRDVIAGRRNVSSVFEAMLTFGLSSELLMDKLNSQKPSYTMVSTHPGFLKTDLHRGQGWKFDALEAALVTLMGVSEDECGMRQASILASDRLREGGLSLVDFIGVGRTKSPQLQRLIDDHGDWLWSFLVELEEQKRGSCPTSI